MNDLVYPHERTLGTITLVLGILAWAGLIAGTFGIALCVLLAGFVLYLVLHSALISHIRGNGVRLTEAQFPDLYAQFTACCERLRMPVYPQAYLLNGGGGFGLLILVYGAAVLASVGIPAYKNYRTRAALSLAVAGTQDVRAALKDYFEQHHEVPESLDAIGLPPEIGKDIRLLFDRKSMIVTVATPQGALVLTPHLDANKRVFWTCNGGEGVKPTQIPLSCRIMR